MAKRETIATLHRQQSGAGNAAVWIPRLPDKVTVTHAFRLTRVKANLTKGLDLLRLVERRAGRVTTLENGGRHCVACLV